MINPLTIYSMIYALAASNGRHETLFGPYEQFAIQAFERSIATDDFPELWFEMPLAGEPWFDVHVLTHRSSTSPNTAFADERTGGNRAVFEWFAAQDDNVRQLALSWDTSKGEIEHPAVQLLMSRRNPVVASGFLKAAGRPDAVSSYLTFVERIPRDWFACYMGVFPERPGHHLRIECIPTPDRQRMYAKDPNVLASDLRQAGYAHFDDTFIERCCALASTPFELEFQFDVMSDGTAGPTMGTSLRFNCPPGSETWSCFTVDGAAGALMRQIEAQGLVDGRWKLLKDTAFAKRISLKDESCTIFCYPAFVKLRWSNGVPVDAKTYLIAGTQ